MKPSKITMLQQLKCIVVLFCALFSMAAYAEDAHDPLIQFNKIIWKFNSKMDQWIIKPSAKAYQKVTPDILESGISNIFRNLKSLPTAFNNLLQGKPGAAGQDVARFVFNTTFGGLGLYDFASDIGLPVHDEDFGQTLGAWGVPSGPYIVLPFLGPSSLRDSAGFAIDTQLDPKNQLNPDSDRFALTGLSILDTRVTLMALDGLAPGNEYYFFRDAYLQRRESLVKDGAVEEEEDDFLSDDF